MSNAEIDDFVNVVVIAIAGRGLVIFVSISD